MGMKDSLLSNLLEIMFYPYQQFDIKLDSLKTIFKVGG